MKTQNENKKKRVTLVLFVLGFAVLLAPLFSYFSDFVTGSGTVQAGTLDIDGTYEMYVNGATEPITSLENFNPGDVVVVKATITNSGNKSAYLRDIIEMGTTGLASISGAIEVFAGEVAQEDVDDATALTITDGQIIGEIVVVDGTGTDAETEAVGDEPLALESNVYEFVYTIYFSKDAGNEAQGLALDLTFKTEALQYRNNTSPDWETVETTPVE